MTDSERQKVRQGKREIKTLAVRHQATALYVICFAGSVWAICVCVCALACLSICVYVGDVAHSAGCVCGAVLANLLFICKEKCENTNYVMQPTVWLLCSTTGASFTRTQAAV